MGVYLGAFGHIVGDTAPEVDMPIHNGEPSTKDTAFI
jgi:hypothetical protein